jgi:hypothetical protein
MNVLLSIGDMPHEHVTKNTELFARGLMPAFRDAAAPAAAG